MTSTQDPQLIFYLGPADVSKTRLVLRTITASPRTLIVTLQQDPYSFRSRHWHDFACPYCEQLHVLHDARHVRIAGPGNWEKEVLSDRVYDRIFFKDLPEPFCRQAKALDLARSLARLALLRSADIVIDLDVPDETAIEHWETSLHAQWLGFWINTRHACLRYIRMPAAELLSGIMEPDKPPAHHRPYENPR